MSHWSRLIFSKTIQAAIALIAGIFIIHWPLCAMAAKANSTLDLAPVEKPHTPPNPEELKRAEEIEMSAPPSLAPNKQRPDFFYYYRQALGAHFGGRKSFEHLSTGTESPDRVLGMQYRFFTSPTFQLELGADLLANGEGLINATKFKFTDDESFRYFYKYGIELRVVPDDQMLTLLQLDNWRAQVGTGFEWNLANGPTAIRLDLVGHVGLKNPEISILFGLSHSFQSLEN